jgi:hypothetical protein
MSNNNGTITPSLVAQQALPILTANFPFLKAFVSDFSDEVVSPLYSEVINTRIPSLQAVSSYSPTLGYVAATGNMTNVAVTINQHRNASIKFTDQEMSSTDLNLIDQYAESLAYGLGNDIMSAVASLWTTGNYSTVVSSAGAPLGRVSGVATARKALETNLVPQNDRYWISGPQAEFELFSDPSLVKLTYGAQGINENGIPDAMGFKFGTYQSMPTTAGLLAVAFQKSAIVIAARAPAIASNASQVAFVENIIDPRSGLTIQVRQYYLPQLGLTQVDYVVMYGVAVGNPQCLAIVTH